MSSSSASTQANQTQNNTTQDNRIVGEAGSVNFAASNNNSIQSTDQSTTIYNTLDAGAVGKSFDFAEAVTKGSASLAAASVGNMKDLSFGAIDAVRDAYGDSAEGVQAAWNKAGAAIADNTKMSISAITSANANTNAQVADAYKGVTGALADAWQTSKAGEQKMLAFGMVAIVGIGLVKVMGSR
jgi:hypothetical protein